MAANRDYRGAGLLDEIATATDHNVPGTGPDIDVRTQRKIAVAVDHRERIRTVQIRATDELVRPRVAVTRDFGKIRKLEHLAVHEVGGNGYVAGTAQRQDPGHNRRFVENAAGKEHGRARVRHAECMNTRDVTGCANFDPGHDPSRGTGNAGTTERLGDELRLGFNGARRARVVYLVRDDIDRGGAVDGRFDTARLECPARDRTAERRAVRVRSRRGETDRTGRIGYEFAGGSRFRTGDVEGRLCACGRDKID